MRERTYTSTTDQMIGRTILEFRIEEKLAEGGMGAVYLGRHVRLPSVRKVAKVLLPAYAGNPVLRRRFHREAEAASKLKHERILEIDNFGELPDGQLFIMVPYLEGQPLDVYLRARGGRLSPHRALHIVVQLCDALDHAHAHGIVHRDLKPSNVFLVATHTNPYAVRLLDFGVAKFLEESADPETHSGVAIGTPSYMAVEQYEHGDEVTPLADVYSLGVMLWELVTGRLPWQHADRAVLYHLQRTVIPKRPSPSEMPLEWSRLLLAALSVDPIVRPRSVRELAISLASALPAEGRMPSGTEILAALAPHFVRKSGPGDETVRNASDVDRMAPLLWPARETTGELARPAAGEQPAGRELTPAGREPPAAREQPAGAPAPQVGELPAAPREPGAPGSGPDPIADPRRARRKLAIAAAAAIAVTAVGITARVSRVAEPAPAATLAAAAPPGTGPVLGGAPPAVTAADPSGPVAAPPPPSGPAGAGPPEVAPGGAVPAAALREIGASAAIAATQEAQARAFPRQLSGELGVYVRPWALVYVDGHPMGQTPYRARLPSGSYRVRMKNDDIDKDEEVTVKVTPSVPTSVRRTW
jgi:Protein kinase domain/PEGA domain